MQFKELVILFWDAVDNHMLVRRGILVFASILTASSYYWAANFASTHADKSGTEIGLIVAAVTAPVSMLMKSVVEIYNNARKTS